MWTAEDVAEEFNDGERLMLNDEGNRQTAIWTDPETGRQFRFKFTPEGIWTGYSSGWSSTSVPPPKPSDFDQSTESIRRMIAGWNSGIAPVAWLLLLVLLLAWPRYRCVISELMLATALIAGTAWLVNPGYSLTVQGIFSNDMLFWAVVMLVLSGVAVARVHSAREQSSEPLCPVCEYNLTGNTSGRCPECGTTISRATRRNIDAHAV